MKTKTIVCAMAMLTALCACNKNPDRADTTTTTGAAPANTTPVGDIPKVGAAGDTTGHAVPNTGAGTTDPTNANTGTTTTTGATGTTDSMKDGGHVMDPNKDMKDGGHVMVPSKDMKDGGHVGTVPRGTTPGQNH